MSYGVTAAGFVRKTYEQIKTELLDAIEDAIGTDARQALEDSTTAFSKAMLTIAEREASLWEVAEAVYNAMYPGTADDDALDGVVTLTGITRQAATHSTVTEVLKGAVGTTIGRGSKVKTATFGDEFETTAAITLSSSVCSHAYIDLLGAAAAGNYVVTINTTSFTYVAGGGDTQATILAGLKALINAGSEPVTSDDSTGELVVTGNTDAATGDPTPFSVTLSSNFQLTAVGNLQAMQSVDTGPIVAMANNLTSIVTPAAGWTAAWNLLAAEVGRSTEKHAALRIRRAQSLATPGSGTVEAIRAAVLAVANVIAAFVIDNPTDAIVDTVPPHAFETVALGGTSAKKAAAIWVHKPAGIYSQGGTSYTVTDSQGFQQVVRFTTPTTKEMWVKLTYTEDTEAGTFPDDGEAQMKDAVETWGKYEAIGHDALPALIGGAVLAAVPGIRTLQVEVADDVAGAPGVYQTAPWVIGSRELAAYDSSRVQVV